ncbi:MAG: DUF423 domain-containing protein [Rhodomicrobium sp.]
MAARFWIFLAGLFGASAVVAGAIGAHALPGGAYSALETYRTGQLYHALHALALLGVGVLMLQTEASRARFASWAFQIAALAFTVGIVCFSGGIYVQVARGYASSAGIVPAGGMSFILGWAVLAIGALGMRGKRTA